MKALTSKKSTFLILTALAVVLLISSVSGVAYAYFTTYVTAHGGRTVELETEITVREELQDLKKTVRIVNTGECDCWVRVKAVIPAGYQVVFSNDANWVQQEDGFWYFTAQLPVSAETASPFVVSVTGLPKINGEQPHEFNVVILAESIPCAGIDEEWMDAAWSLQAHDPA